MKFEFVSIYQLKKEIAELEEEVARRAAEQIEVVDVELEGIGRYRGLAIKAVDSDVIHLFSRGSTGRIEP